MRAFSIPRVSSVLAGQYPVAEHLRSALFELNGVEFYAMLRLLFSEGVPHVFRTEPLLYEAIRDWLSLRLNVHPKDITVIGSARIGYSVSPVPKYGNGFNSSSDLDLACVSNSLFQKVTEAFVTWETDVERNRVKPRNPREAGFWKENLRVVRDGIGLGFIDPYKIPTWTRYPISAQIQETLYVTGEKLKVTSTAPRFSKISLRVYRNWDTFFRHLSLNFSFTIRSLRSIAPSLPMVSLDKRG
jgi:hypothetical protein